jgi:hypothetical protein
MERGGSEHLKELKKKQEREKERKNLGGNVV